MIKAIIFDCFGVLTADLWKEFVATLPENQKQAARDLNHALDAGMIDHKEFYAQIFNLTGSQPQQVESFLSPDIQKNQPLFEYIKELSRDYQIGLLSNISSDWVTRVFLLSEEAALFNAKIFSYQIGVTKPEERAYTAAAEKLGVETAECIMVDDSEINCQGARTAGMQAILYQDFETLKKDLKSILM